MDKAEKKQLASVITNASSNYGAKRTNARAKHWCDALLAVKYIIAATDGRGSKSERQSTRQPYTACACGLLARTN